ncbi:hypothetical protein C2S52_012923 [Perilla frutescens var. hirtella]|uniref:Uncharacterized protein n=1 Tax=Perilla frutescens var. hirtella TaxID=608512 RepID=A0AAD4J134_PERFH|nr:hypothetical protein C2S51_015280 [Perilla frutescens var. frutescens]KAH6775362.1 hypothetical protein C2S52_012923 [Perilla frutescens var. hirtella]KAH6795499.1 hypothetical protein C2S51_036485 [Perilla frutescens var. frutescens]KAH6825181.1 hypothetical protein C2S53_008727 [Perilla frutescens var. hirtella]
MKKSGVIAASVAAASATAISSASSAKIHFPREDERAKKSSDNSQGSSSSEKFAPRFDGLRFIETLVTAHR